MPCACCRPSSCVESPGRLLVPRAARTVDCLERDVYGQTPPEFPVTVGYLERRIRELADSGLSEEARSIRTALAKVKGTESPSASLSSLKAVLTDVLDALKEASK